MSLCWIEWDEVFKWTQPEESHSVRLVIATYMLITAAWWRHVHELPDVWAAGFEEL
jgi:hypothetical protein